MNMITFIDYKYKKIGGVGQLVVNTTLEMNRRGKCTKVYCSQESYEYKCLKEWDADFIFIDSDLVPICELKNHLTPEDVIVLTNIGETLLLEEIKPLNNKIIFYSVHPDTFFSYNKVLNLLYNHKKATLELISSLDRHRALLIMDWPNLKVIYDNGGEKKESVSYLPVPVMRYSEKHRSNKPNCEVNVTYLGRGNDKWKIYPLIKVLEDMNICCAQARLTIITDVNTLFEQMIKKYIPNNRVTVSYINNLHGEDLEDYLYNNSTLHIAMGTSALEGAKLGIPTILIDYSKQKFPDNYKYRWLYECEDYCLAGEVKNGQLPYEKGKLFKEIWQSIATEEGYKNESEKCRQYNDFNHSICSFADRLEEACNKTTMTTQIYCNTKFSKNLYSYLQSPLRIIGTRIKRFILGNPYDI